jgi:TetR/AcrR family transcriptional regulator
MLEATPDNKITTAKIAAAVGVSEAALYRHFPSKTKMFEALIAFAEEALFLRIGRVTEGSLSAIEQCHALVRLYLEFCEKNHGISRLLTGGALTGESRQLHYRIAQLYERLETQLRQYLREAELREGCRPRLPVNTAANLIMAFAEGRIHQFCRSGFKSRPTDNWQDQWEWLGADLMRAVPPAASS